MIHREISDRKSQMDSLDGLRGFAALIVVFSHTSNSGMFFIPFLDLRGIGKSGVFLFFLLSSFLLTLALLRNGKEVLTFPVMAHYWQRRFFRIYPLYTFYLLLVVISTLVFTALGKDGFGIPFALDWHGFFKQLTLQEGKGITWSIVVEFKFYFILPILVLAIERVRTYGPLATLLFFLSLLLLTQIISPQSESATDDTRLLPYMPIFIIGMFLAVLQDYSNNTAGQTKMVTSIYKYLGFIGLAGVIVMTPLVFSLFGDRVPNNHFHKQFILYALFWSFILLSSVNVQGVIQKFFLLPIFRFYGALSFSLYLFHRIFIVAMNYFEINKHISAWLVLLASTGSAYISFRLFEGPISKYKISNNSLVFISHIISRYIRKK
jgi:peptidoglycan/LPS O-acetylase OafA/YrhL